MTTTLAIDLATVSRREINAINVLLASLAASGDAEAPALGGFVPAPIPHLVGENVAPVEMELGGNVNLAGVKAAEEAEPTKAVEPPAAETKRRRRTKAEIEADAAAEAAKAAPIEPVVAVNPDEKASATSTEPEPLKEAPAASTDGEPTEAALKAALTHYKETHDMAAASALVQDFGCTRFSDLLGLPLSEKLTFIKCAHE